MRRRALLVAVSGSLAALAGCTRFDGPFTEDSSSVGAHPGPTSHGPPAETALVVEESDPIEGTDVNLGAGGTARNTASTALVDCVVAVTGTVGNREFSADARRARLEPDETWGWAVAFGEEADAMPEDPVEAISIDTRASCAA